MRCDNFNTLRGFLKGEEEEKETYFAYSASLRISGDIPSLGEITKALGLEPTLQYRKGDRLSAQSPPKTFDMWSYTVPIHEEEELHKHIDALWILLKPQKDYLMNLKKSLTVDVFLGYRTNIDCAGVEVPHTSLEMFTELQIPFGMSIIIA